MTTQTIPAQHVEAPTFVNPRNPTERLTVVEIFGPRFDDAVIEIGYHLNTHRMKQFFRRDFVHLSQMLHAIERYRGIWTLDTVRLDAVETHLAKKLDAVRELLQLNLRECEAAIYANGHADKQVHFSQPVTYVVPIISPFAREYMELLVLADSTFAKVAACHLLGLITSGQKTTIESKCRRSIRALAQTVRFHRITLAKFAAKARDGADDEARKIIDDAVGREVMALVKQGAEEPDVKAAVSHEADLDRMVESTTPAPAFEDRAPVEDAAAPQAFGAGEPLPAPAIEAALQP